MAADKLDSKTRQVAILLTSVDTPTARSLLSQFPTEHAKRIRAAMTQLGTVTPEERRAALDQFERMRQASAPTPTSPAESLALQANQSIDAIDLSPQARQYAREPNLQPPAVYENPKPSEPNHPWAQLTGHDLSELLAAERPIVIAVVLNQIPTQLAASLLQLLPEPLAMSAMGLLPQVQGTPADILQEIQQQLEERLKNHQLPLRANQEGMQRLRTILEHADARFREQCKHHICRQEPTLARRLGWDAEPLDLPSPTPYSPPSPSTKNPPPVTTPHSTTNHSRNHASQNNTTTPLSAISPSASSAPLPPSTQRDGVNLSPSPLTAENSPPNPRNNAHPTPTSSQPTIRMSFEEVTLLPPKDLVQVLHSATPDIVLMALRGAPDPFYQRVRKLLTPRDAKRLDARMNQSITLSLREIDQAQRRLAEIASDLLTAGQIGSLVSLTITAAA